MRILLVEDDAMIARSLVRALADYGMSVDWVRDAAHAKVAIAAGEHELALLDLGLPDSQGLDLLKTTRTEGFRLPIIIVTARSAVEERVSGLKVGADDYVTKPFVTQELAARIEAVLRRKGGNATSQLLVADLTLDLDSHLLSSKDAEQLLPPREFALMRALMERPGTILSRAQLEERLYGWGEEVESNAVDVLIYSIRKKFGRTVILNVRGAGWMVTREKP